MDRLNGVGEHGDDDGNDDEKHGEAGEPVNMELMKSARQRVRNKFRHIVEPLPALHTPASGPAGVRMLLSLR